MYELSSNSSDGVVNCDAAIKNMAKNALNEELWSDNFPQKNVTKMKTNKQIFTRVKFIHSEELKITIYSLSYSGRKL